MYLDSPFARPVSSFRRPAPVLDVDPDVQPDKTVCFRSEWTPYIVGALRQLLLQTTWATDDPNELNLMQARAQLLIALFMEGCSTDDQPVPFIVDEMEYQMSICEQLRWDNGVLQALCCGDWVDIGGTGGAGGSGAGAVPGAVTQPPPSDPPDLGGCASYFVTLTGNNKWLLPFPVNAGDTLLIEDATGGWTDGTLGWFCPTGKVYLGGTCNADQPGEVTDPIPTVNHMQIVGHLLGDDTWFDPMSGLYTFPSGVADQAVALQANDGGLSDNGGSVTFKLIVCHQEAVNWTSTYDYSLGPLGWTAKTCATPDFPCDDPANDGTAAGTWNGFEWHFVQPGATSDVLLSIQSPAFDASYIRSVTVYTNDSGLISNGDGKSGMILSYEDAGGFHEGSPASVPGGAQTNGLLLEIGGVTRIVISLNDYSGSQTANILKVVIEGTGAKPPQLS